MIHFHANIVARIRCLTCDRTHELVCYILKEEMERLAREEGFTFGTLPGQTHVVMHSCPGCERYEPTGLGQVLLPAPKEGQP